MAPRSTARTHAEPRSRFGRLTLVLTALTVALAALLATTACTPKPAATTTPEPAPQPAQTATPTPPAPQATELKIEDTKVGTGAEAKVGDTVRVHYTGYQIGRAHV